MKGENKHLVSYLENHSILQSKLLIFLVSPKNNPQICFFFSRPSLISTSINCSHYLYLLSFNFRRILVHISVVFPSTSFILLSCTSIILSYLYPLVSLSHSYHFFYSIYSLLSSGFIPFFLVLFLCHSLLHDFFLL